MFDNRWVANHCASSQRCTLIYSSGKFSRRLAKFGVLGTVERGAECSSSPFRDPAGVGETSNAYPHPPAELVNTYLILGTCVCENGEDVGVCMWKRSKSDGEWRKDGNYLARSSTSFLAGKSKVRSVTSSRPASQLGGQAGRQRRWTGAYGSNCTRCDEAHVVQLYTQLPAFRRGVEYFLCGTIHKNIDQ